MVVIIRYAEIGIKGKNREKFELSLIKNIEACLRTHQIHFENVRRTYGRILIETNDSCSCLRHVFGIASFSQSIRAGTTVDEAFISAHPFVALLAESDSFRVSCQRLDKKFPLTSQELCAQLGEKLMTVTKAKVKMKQATIDVKCEIIDGFIYVLTNRAEGIGGMPTGSQGKVIALIENNASILAALLIMKRGCAVVPALLNQNDHSLLKAYAHQHWIESEHINSIQELDAYAIKHYASAIVINDAVEHIREIGLKTLILRPLIAYTDEDIANELKKFQCLFAAD